MCTFHHSIKVDFYSFPHFLTLSISPSRCWRWRSWLHSAAPCSTASTWQSSTHLHRLVPSTDTSPRLRPAWSCGVMCDPRVSFSMSSMFCRSFNSIMCSVPLLRCRICCSAKIKRWTIPVWTWTVSVKHVSFREAKNNRFHNSKHYVGKHNELMLALASSHRYLGTLELTVLNQ